MKTIKKGEKIFREYGNIGEASLFRWDNRDIALHAGR